MWYPLNLLYLFSVVTVQNCSIVNIYWLLNMNKFYAILIPANFGRLVPNYFYLLIY